MAGGVLVHNTEWQPYQDADSPDRVDALVYAATELLTRAAPASVASPTHLRLIRGRIERESTAEQAG